MYHDNEIIFCPRQSNCVRDRGPNPLPYAVVGAYNVCGNFRTFVRSVMRLHSVKPAKIDHTEHGTMKYVIKNNVG